MLTSLPDADREAVDGTAHIRALVLRYVTFASRLRFGIEYCQEMKDPASEDLLVEVLRAIEMDLWFLDSHLPDNRPAESGTPPRPTTPTESLVAATPRVEVKAAPEKAALKKTVVKLEGIVNA